ncbi:hypothetical protein GGI04_003113 [Coemansia thaxteri]|nr:hypothetical protein GGI04_003113 [Coemansia thaxteri]
MGYQIAQYEEPNMDKSASSSAVYNSSAAATNIAASADAQIAASNYVASDSDVPSGVVFDQSVGQYYDTNSGQYYDEPTGTWYYLQTAPLYDATTTAPGPAIVPGPAADYHASQQLGDGAADDAAFFDNLGATHAETGYSNVDHEASRLGNAEQAMHAWQSSHADTLYPTTATSFELSSGASIGLEAVQLATDLRSDGVTQAGYSIAEATENVSASVSLNAAISGANVAATYAPVNSGMNQSIEPGTLPSDSTDGFIQLQETSNQESSATSETMGRSTAAASQPFLPTPSLSVNWSVQAEHDSASSIVDTAVETHMSDAVSSSVTESSQANETPAADSYIPLYNDASLYYSHQHGAQRTLQTGAALVPAETVVYESVDAQYTQGTSGIAVAGYPEFSAYDDGATMFGESFEADDVPAPLAHIPVSEQFQPPVVATSLADGSGYAAYAPYSGSFTTEPAGIVEGVFEPSGNAANRDAFNEVPVPSTRGGSEALHSEIPFAMAMTAHEMHAGAVGDMNQHSYRTVSSLSGPAIPQPLAMFDMQSHSERTSTDISFYDRDRDTATATATMATDNVDFEQHAGAGIYDSLGRLNACRPVVSFGFGGRLVTMFPRQVQRFNIYDSGKASKVTAGMLQIGHLSDHIPCDSYPHSTPLLTGEITRVALVKRRDVAVACAKSWMASMQSAGLLGEEERVLCDVLVALLGSLGLADSSNNEFSAALNALQPLIVDRIQDVNDERSADEMPPISHGSREQLQELEALLLKGKRTDAIDLARRQGLWTHALIIASCTGKQHWQSVVSSYASSVLQGGHPALGIQYRMFSGLGSTALDESELCLADDPSVGKDEFVTAADMGTASMPPFGRSEHPRDAHADLQPNDGSIGHCTSDWARILSLMLANRTPGDQAAILKLGDRLKDSGQAMAAHICYVLTLQSKDLFLPDAAEASSRAVLLGTSELELCRISNSAFDMPVARYSRFYRKPAAIFLTELYEVAFAMKAAASSDAQQASITTGAAPAAAAGPATAASSGASSSANGGRPAMLQCLPHLQAYKLYHAWWLVDCGQAALASRYCDAVLGILATLPQGVPVPFIHASLVQELRSLRDRLSGSGMTSIKAAEIVGDDSVVSGASSKSWLARAMPRPSFTSLMSAFDSSIDKFITGADGNRISLESSAVPGKYEVGPDRNPQQPGQDAERLAGPPRPLGAVGWNGRTPSPRVFAATITNGHGEAAKTSEAYSPAFGSPRQSLDGRPSGLAFRDGGGGSEPPRMYTPINNASAMDQMVYGFSQLTTQPASQPQWGDPGNMAYSAHQGEHASSRTSFGDSLRVSDARTSFSTEAPASVSAQSAPPAQAAGDDGEEDMFGFSRRQPAAKPVHEMSARPSADAARSTTPSTRQSADGKGEKAVGKDDAQANDKGGSGVLGMIKSLWGGRKNQANLGEESHFVYDPVQKRWIDKNAPADQQDPGPPPPPPPSAMRFQPQSASVPPPTSAGFYSQGPPGVAAHEFAATTGSTPLGFDVNRMDPLSRGPAMDNRAQPAFPPAFSASLSRVGSPAPSLGALGAGSTPPASSGGRGGKRRAARSKYVDVLNE